MELRQQATAPAAVKPFNAAFLADGQSVLTYYGLDGSNMNNFIGFLVLFFLFWFVMAWLTLSYKKYSNR